jgi:regulator of cell morphogenesis and NO signaling
LSRAFEAFEIDYCCGGKKSIEDACREKNIDPKALIAKLAETEPDSSGATAHLDITTMTLSALADHVEQTHHAYLRSELPRLDQMTEKVSTVHGAKEPRLHQLRRAFLGLAQELSTHMMKEEQILFPMIRQLEESESAPSFHCGTLANPIHQMESEHDETGAALTSMRELTDGFTPPEWACNTYRAMLDALAELERDIHQHIHKENNVLFPRALAMEVEKQRP